jgi:hypothetical protein
VTQEEREFDFLGVRQDSDHPPRDLSAGTEHQHLLHLRTLGSGAFTAGQEKPRQIVKDGAIL